MKWKVSVMLTKVFPELYIMDTSGKLRYRLSFKI